MSNLFGLSYSAKRSSVQVIKHDRRGISKTRTQAKSTVPPFQCQCTAPEPHSHKTGDQISTRLGEFNRLSSSLLPGLPSLCPFSPSSSSVARVVCASLC